MWSTFDSSWIRSLLDDLKTSYSNWTLWQTSTQGRLRFTVQIKNVKEDLTQITITEGDIEDINLEEAIFCHCPEPENNTIFKREKFIIEDKVTLSFKTPIELKREERRKIDRFIYKYQDFKEITFKTDSQENKALTFILVDLSISGLAFIASAKEAENLAKAQQIEITHLTDQKLDSSTFGSIAYLSRFRKKEGLKDRANSKELIRVGVQFDRSLDSVTFKSIDSIIEKKQESTKGLDIQTFNGLTHEEIHRKLKRISEEDHKTSVILSEQIEEIDRLRYLTPRMKRLFWQEVNKDFLASALRLASKDLIYDLLHDISENTRNEFLEKLSIPKPISVIEKAQAQICQYIKDREEASEFLLDPNSFSEEV